MIRDVKAVWWHQARSIANMTVLGPLQNPYPMIAVQYLHWIPNVVIKCSLAELTCKFLHHLLPREKIGHYNKARLDQIKEV